MAASEGLRRKTEKPGSRAAADAAQQQTLEPNAKGKGARVGDD